MGALLSRLWAVLWATARATITQDVGAGVTPEQAFAFYWDLRNQRRVHPFIVSAAAEAVAPGEQRFEIIDRVPLLGGWGMTLALQGRMRVTQRSDDLIELHSTAHTTACDVDHVLTISRCPGGCRLEEHASFTAPRPLLGFTARNGVAAHQRQLKRMAELLEEEAAGAAGGTQERRK